MLRTREEWFEHAIERGTSGDMVFDILKDWKSTEKETKIYIITDVYDYVFADVVVSLEDALVYARKCYPVERYPDVRVSRSAITEYRNGKSYTTLYFIEERKIGNE